MGSDTTRLCHVPSRRRTGRWKAGSDALGAAASRRRARSGGWSISRGEFLPPASDNSNACRLSVWFAGFCGSTWRPFHRESNAGGRSAAPRAIPSAPVSRTVFARDILFSADGLSNKDIAARLRLNQVTVGLWRRRFVKQGLTGLHEELRPGRPRSIPDEKVATLIRRTLRSKPKDGTHWSCRSLAAETRLSKSTVHRIWRAFALQPHRTRHFQLSNDPLFVE